MLAEMIDAYLETRPADKERAKNCFHPSSLHRHPRELKRMYFSGDDAMRPAGRILRIFDNGHAVHERLQRYLKGIGVLIEGEAHLENKELEISGNCDGIVEIGGKKGIIEIKSINAKGFALLSKPKAEHMGQLNIYMFCLGIPNGLLLYEDKNTQSLKEFYLKQDEAVLNHIFSKIRYTQHCIREAIEPAQDWLAHWDEIQNNVTH